jgi:hypothetical protein
MPDARTQRAPENHPEPEAHAGTRQSRVSHTAHGADRTANTRAGGGPGGAPPPGLGGGGAGGGAPGQSAAAQRPVAASDRGLCSRFQV